MLISQAKIKKIFFPCLLVSGMLLSACESPEKSAESSLQKGKELFEKGEYDKALLELKTSTQEGNQSETYYYMALLDEKSNNFKAMRENLLKVVDMDPNNVEARQKLGKVNLLFGDLDKAAEQADFLLKVNSNNEEAKLLKASILIRQNNKPQATELIDSVCSKLKLTQNKITLKVLSKIIKS